MQLIRLPILAGQLSRTGHGVAPISAQNVAVQPAGEVAPRHTCMWMLSCKVEHKNVEGMKPRTSCLGCNLKAVVYISWGPQSFDRLRNLETSACIRTSCMALGSTTRKGQRTCSEMSHLRVMVALHSAPRGCQHASVPAAWQCKHSKAVILGRGSAPALKCHSSGSWLPYTVHLGVVSMHPYQLHGSASTARQCY